MFSRYSQISTNQRLRMFFTMMATALAVLGWQHGVEPSLRTWAAQSWMAVNGDIVGVNLVQEVRHHKGGSTTYFRPEVSYSYVVGGTHYQSSRISFFSFETTDRREAARALDNFKPGTKVTCFVDPGDPTSAVLDRSTTNTTTGNVMLALAATILSVALAYEWHRRRHEQNSTLVGLRVWTLAMLLPVVWLTMLGVVAVDIWDGFHIGHVVALLILGAAAGGYVWLRKRWPLEAELAATADDED